jgi:hypothetical protein
MVRQLVNLKRLLPHCKNGVGAFKLIISMSNEQIIASGFQVAASSDW